MRRADMVVVGAGVVGAATAWWAAAAGFDVVLLERYELGHRHGSSHGGVRIFRQAYPDPLYVALANEARELWRRLEGESGETLLELTGAIDLGHPPGVQATAAALAAAGVPHEVLTPEAAAERFAGFAFSGPVLFHPGGGRCWAARSVSAFVRAAVANGCELHERAAVRAITPHGEEADVATDDETYRSARVVVAAGAWVADVLDGMVRLPPLRVTREQPVHLRPLEPTTEWPSFIEHAPHKPFDTYGLLEPGVGLKLGEHMTGPVVHPDRRSFEPDEAALERMRAHARRLLPGVDPEPVAVDTCLYTSTGNEDFVIDRVGPLTVASACSGHGFKFGPATGALVADVALGRRPAPDRFRLG
jgi:sarcosine oxidase